MAKRNWKHARKRITGNEVQPREADMSHHAKILIDFSSACSVNNRKRSIEISKCSLLIFPLTLVSFALYVLKLHLYLGFLSFLDEDSILLL